MPLLLPFYFPLGGEGASCCVECSCQLGSRHDNVWYRKNIQLGWMRIFCRTEECQKHREEKNGKGLTSLSLYSCSTRLSSGDVPGLISLSNISFHILFPCCKNRGSGPQMIGKCSFSTVVPCGLFYIDLTVLWGVEML